RGLAPVSRWAARLARGGVRLLAADDARLARAVHRRGRRGAAGAGVFRWLYGTRARRGAQGAARHGATLRRLPARAARAVQAGGDLRRVPRLAARREHPRRRWRACALDAVGPAPAGRGAAVRGVYDRARRGGRALPAPDARL